MYGFDTTQGLTKLKSSKILFKFLILSKLSVIYPCLNFKSTVISESGVQGIRTVWPSSWNPSFSVIVTVTTSVHGTTKLLKSTRPPALILNYPHLNMDPRVSEKIEMEI